MAVTMFYMALIGLILTLVGAAASWLAFRQMRWRYSLLALATIFNTLPMLAPAYLSESAKLTVAVCGFVLSVVASWVLVRGSLRFSRSVVPNPPS